MGDELYLLVDDDGFGLLFDGVCEGIGLGNMWVCLCMLFGDDVWFELWFWLGGGICVEVCLLFVMGVV